MVSVIIPCYNSEKHIARAVQSVLAQSYKNWELILVNNNSTDNTVQILLEYQNKYPEKITVFQEFKKGAPAARNKGLQEAKGDWIQFLDADDELLPEKLKVQLYLAEQGDPSIIVSGFKVHGTRDGVSFERERTVDKTDIWKGLIRSQMGITSANLWKKAMLVSVDGWDEKLVSSQEYDLMFRILQLSPNVAFDQSNLVIIHVGSEESVSRGGDEVKVRSIIDTKIALRLRIKEYLSENKMFTKELSESVDEFIFGTLVHNYRFRPQYVKDQLSSLSLHIPLNVKVRGVIFMRKMDLKRALPNFIVKMLVHQH